MDEHKLYHTRITLAFQDLKECEWYGKLLIKNSIGNLGSDDRIIYDALLTSFFVSYGRAFTQSNTTSKELTPRIKKRFKEFLQNLIDGLSEREQILHKYTMAQRDQIFAHSDENALGLTMNKTFDSIWYIGDNITKQYPNKKIEEILNLCDYFTGKIYNEKNEIEKKYPEAFEGIG